MSDGFISPLDNPEAANAQLSAMLHTPDTENLPVIDLPADDTVRLPGGLVQHKYGHEPVILATEATVRELNGADEEAIYKARRKSPLRLMATILSCGTERLGEHHTNSGLLKDLLIGDRDALILGIRRATYGDEVEYGQVMCAGCEELLDIKVTLDDIPVKRLSDPVSDTRFQVPLWKGGFAKVRLPNGHDQEAVAEAGETNPAITDSEVNSVMLSRCVLSVVDKSGEETVTSNNLAAVNRLGLKDRKSILSAITDRQPGPRYDEVKFTHESCGKETALFLTVADLFREL